jgi:hypothetical protein
LRRCHGCCRAHWSRLDHHRGIYPS